MLRTLSFAALLLLVVTTPRVSQSQISLSPLTSFGGLSTGWLPPSGFPSSTGTDGNIRDIAFNPSTGSLLVAGATTAVPIDAVTGTFGTALPTGGLITGGAKAFNTVAVTSDGVIYGGNLTSQSTTSPLKVYRWASQAASAPTVHYQGNGGLAGSRIGDDLAAFGSDATGLLAFGFGNTPAVTGNNSFTTVTTGASGGTASAVAYTGGAAGDFRLGITFLDADTVLGTQSLTARRVSFTGSSGQLDGSTTLTATNERGLLYFSAYGTPLLATQEYATTGTQAGANTVRLYDASSLLTNGTVSLLQTINLATTAAANGNATGDIAFGLVNGTPTIYALSTNNGIQAFSVVPEPGSIALVVAAAGLGFASLRRRAALGRRG